MRKWLVLGSVVACAAALASGCGSGGNTGSFVGDDGGPDGGGGSSSGSSSGAGSGGVDASVDATSGSSGGWFDASLLDIAVPDAFARLDASGSSSGAVDAGDGAAGCFPDGVTCQGNVATTCSGGVSTTTTCTASQSCVNGFGCVVCQPGTGSCSGNVGTACNAAGTGYVTNNCDPALGETCTAGTGTCAGDCANVGTSYIGCEYYAITMTNSLLAQGTFPYAVSISNTSTTTPASVTITGPGYSSAPSIPAGGIIQVVLPWVSSLSMSNSSTVLVGGGAYHIKSTEPVAVYQFNPRDYTLAGAYSYTNDASLLLPVNAMTQKYYVVTGATWDVYSGTVAVVATQDGTKVTYAAPGGNTITAGGGLGAGGGTSATLNHGDVLQIAASPNGSATAFGSDQSGALVTATAPVEVFGGVDCTNMPAAVQYCDHIEEIVLPFETLRDDYLVVRPTNDYATPRQFVKIVGTAAGTTLTYDPPIAGAPATLGAGQSSFFQATVDFHVKSSSPIIVGQFMESQNNFGSTCFNSQNNALNCGDPAESIAVATGQFRSSYQFIAPPTYNENWVSVIAPNGATVTVDGTNHTSGTAIGSSSGYWTLPVKLCSGSCSGVHQATGTAPFGIEVYGYGAYTSYMYPGGLNLNR